jgi:protein-L-isoaspartate(D-aspartate) O-methyltransferase
MVDLLRKEVRDQRVVEAMAGVPRDRFVPQHLRTHAYDDRALPIGHGQTISQPLIVGLMVEALQLASGDRVLEIGTGSGYAAAVIARIAREVITVERIPELAERARALMSALGIENVRTLIAGQELGYKACAPYDAILVSAAAPHVPRALVDQLAAGGRLVVPIGTRSHQELVRATKTPFGLELVRLGPCAFVPLIGEGGWDIGETVSRRANLP